MLWRTFPCGCKIYSNKHGELLRHPAQENTLCGRDYEDCYVEYACKGSTRLAQMGATTKVVRQWVLQYSQEDIIENIKEIMK